MDRIRRTVRWHLAPDRVPQPTGPPAPSPPELEALFSQPDRQLDVARGATLIAAEDDPALDTERVLDEVDRLAWLVRQRLRQAPPQPALQLATLNHVFFEEVGFNPAPHARGRSSSDRLADLLLPHVLRWRRGHCVGLSSAYLAVGYRVGLPLFGVSVPGHFFVRWDGRGLRRNVELTARGISHPDEYYVERFRVGREQVDRGVYLQNLRRREVLVEILNNRANVYWDRGDPARASRDLDRVVQLSHNFARAYAGRGFIGLQQGDLDAAQQDLERALALDPDYGRARLLLGQLQLRQGWVDRARESFERATESDPTSGLAATYLGRTYGIRGDVDRALEWHQRAVQADPRCHMAWTHLGRARMAVGEREKAREAFQEALSVQPDSLAARESLVLLSRTDGSLGWRARRVARTLVRDYERHLTTSPGNDALRVQYVRFLLDSGLNPDRALELARQVADATPTSYHLELLGRILLGLGRRSEAVERLERALELDAGHGAAEARRLQALLQEARAASR